METRRLGQSGLSVPVLCLGTMTFGENSEKSMMHGVGSPKSLAFQIMERCLERGLNFFDTADVYGDDGMSERIIGEWFATAGHRDRVILATKFRFRMNEGPNGTGASRYRILRAVDESLRRLRTDRIDLYQIHMQDRDTPEEETLRALDDLVRAGKVLYIGCSNYTGVRLVDSLWLSRTLGLERFVSLQAQYSLCVRGIERELVPACADKGLGILPWSPLAGGFLSGKHTKEERAQGSRLAKWGPWWSKFDNPRCWSALEACQHVARERGATPGQVALAWTLKKPGVTSTIFGARTLEQLEDNLAAATLKLSDAELAALDAASGFEPDYPYDFIRQIAGRW